MSNQKISQLGTSAYKDALIIPAVDTTQSSGQQNVRLSAVQLINQAISQIGTGTATSGTNLSLSGSILSSATLDPSSFELVGDELMINQGTVTGATIINNGTTIGTLTLADGFTINAEGTVSIGNSGTGEIEISSTVTSMALTDLLLIQQGTSIVEITVSHMLSSLGASPTSIAGNGTVDIGSVPDGRRLVFGGAGLVTNTGTTINDGYSILVRNAGTAGNVLFGTGINTDGTLLSGQAAYISAEAFNGTVEVFADVIGGESSNGVVLNGDTLTNTGVGLASNDGTLYTVIDPAIILNPIASPIVNGGITISGGLSAQTVTPSSPLLTYSDNDGAVIAAGATLVTYGARSANFSFTRPGIASAGTTEITVAFADGTASTSQSVIVLSGPALQANTQSPGYVSSSGTIGTAVVSVTPQAYSNTPTLDISVNNGTSWVEFLNGSTLGAGTISGVSASEALVSGTLMVNAGAYVVEFRDHANNAIISAPETLKVAGASIENSPGSITAGSLSNVGTVVLDGITTAYVGLYNSSTLDGTVMATNGGSIEMTPTLFGNELLQVYDAASGGHLLAQGSNITVINPAALPILSAATLVAHFDASVPTSLFADTGGTTQATSGVSRVNDLSGNGNYLAIQSGSSPVIKTAAQNGLTGIGYGSNFWALQAQSGATWMNFFGTDSFTILFAGSSGGTYSCMFGACNSTVGMGNPGDCIFVQCSGSGTGVSAVGRSQGYKDSDPANSGINNYLCGVVTYNGNTGITTLITPNGTFTQVNPSMPTALLYDTFIAGQFPNGNQAFAGNIYEIAAWNGLATDDEITTLVGTYLASKWG